MNRFLSHLISGKLCEFWCNMKLNDVYIWNNYILIHLYNIFFYKMIIMLKSGNGPNFFITANSL